MCPNCGNQTNIGSNPNPDPSAPAWHCGQCGAVFDGPDADSDDPAPTPPVRGKPGTAPPQAPPGTVCAFCQFSGLSAEMVQNPTNRRQWYHADCWIEARNLFDDDRAATRYYHGARA